MIYISSSSEKKLCNHSTIAPEKIKTSLLTSFLTFSNYFVNCSPPLIISEAILKASFRALFNSF